MKLDQLNQWLTLIANVAVLFGLVILIFEINQNTTAIENETRWNRVSTAADILTPLIENEDFTSAFLAYNDSPLETIGLDSEQLSRSEIFRAETQNRLIALQVQARFVTQSETIDQQRATLHAMLLAPGTRDYYERIIDELEPEFATFVQSIIAEIEN